MRGWTRRKRQRLDHLQVSSAHARVDPAEPRRRARPRCFFRACAGGPGLVEGWFRWFEFLPRMRGWAALAVPAARGVVLFSAPARMMDGEVRIGN